MSFWGVTVWNLCMQGFYLAIHMAFLAWWFGMKPRPGAWGRPGMALLLSGLLVLSSATGAALYTQGYFRDSALLWLGDLMAWYVSGFCIAFCFYRVYRESMVICWLLVCLLNLLNDFSANMAGFFLIWNHPFRLAVLKERMLYLAFMVFVIPLVEYTIVLCLKKPGIIRMIGDWLKQKEFSFVSVITISLYPVWIHGVMKFINAKKMLKSEQDNLSILLVLFLLVMFVFGRQKELQRKQIAAQRIMLQQQSAYIDSLEELQREMRRFQHDYKNMMTGVYAQARERDIEAIQRFIEDMTDDFDSQVGGRIREMTQLGNVHMMEVKGLLLGKAEEMKKERIAFELEVFRPFLKTGMRGTDSCRCLGILLDNAIDEVRGMESASVSLMISSQEGCTTFRVKNLLYSDVDFQKIWRQGYSTRGENRGIGLASYKKILERYDNAFSLATVSDGYFIQELKIQE